jgi:hypothetical protein
MPKTFRNTWAIAILTVLLAAGILLTTAAAQKASVPKVQDRLTMGEEAVKQLLPLMNTDAKGMLSKQEYMKFMEAEFERLDQEKKGELDVRKLTQTGLYANRYTGK